MTAPKLDDHLRRKRHRALPGGRVARDAWRLVDLAAAPGTVCELARRWGIAPSGVRRWLEDREWLTVERTPGTVDLWRRRSRG